METEAERYKNKKDLNVKFTGAYLDVTGDDSWKYAKTYQFRVMSPILEGEAVAANNVVEVSATGRTKLYKENIWAKTYNNDVKYDIFAKGKAAGVIEWYRSDIANVTFSTGNKNVFEVTVATPTVPVAATTFTAQRRYSTSVSSCLYSSGVSPGSVTTNATK